MKFTETVGIGTPTRTITHIPTPTAACSYWNWLLGDTFVVYNIRDWTDEDNELAKDNAANPGNNDISDIFNLVKGKLEKCGAVTHWSQDNTLQSLDRHLSSVLELAWLRVWTMLLTPLEAQRRDVRAKAITCGTFQTRWRTTIHDYET